MLAINASRYQEIPGYVERTVIVAGLSTLIFGALGYLFWSGVILKD